MRQYPAVRVRMSDTLQPKYLSDIFFRYGMMCESGEMADAQDLGSCG